jgi:hypothetical protein
MVKVGFTNQQCNKINIIVYLGEEYKTLALESHFGAKCTDFPIKN